MISDTEKIKTQVDNLILVFYFFSITGFYQRIYYDLRGVTCTRKSETHS